MTPLLSASSNELFYRTLEAPLASNSSLQQDSKPPRGVKKLNNLRMDNNPHSKDKRLPRNSSPLKTSNPLRHNSSSHQQLRSYS